MDTNVCRSVVALTPAVVRRVVQAGHRAVSLHGEDLSGEDLSGENLAAVVEGEEVGALHLVRVAPHVARKLLHAGRAVVRMAPRAGVHGAGETLRYLQGTRGSRLGDAGVSGTEGDDQLGLTPMAAAAVTGGAAGFFGGIVSSVIGMFVAKRSAATPPALPPAKVSGEDIGWAVHKRTRERGSSPIGRQGVQGDVIDGIDDGLGEAEIELADLGGSPRLGPDGIPTGIWPKAGSGAPSEDILLMDALDSIDGDLGYGGYGAGRGSRRRRRRRDGWGPTPGYQQPYQRDDDDDDQMWGLEGDMGDAAALLPPASAVNDTKLAVEAIVRKIGDLKAGNQAMAELPKAFLFLAGQGIYPTAPGGQLPASSADATADLLAVSTEDIIGKRVLDLAKPAGVAFYKMATALPLAKECPCQRCERATAEGRGNLPCPSGCTVAGVGCGCVEGEEGVGLTPAQRAAQQRARSGRRGRGSSSAAASNLRSCQRQIVTLGRQIAGLRSTLSRTRAQLADAQA